MTNEELSYILRSLTLDECEFIEGNAYYIKKSIKQMVYNCDIGKEVPNCSEYEFLVIAENGIKKAIILNCGNTDLHWYVLKKWRGMHILSDFLRTGIIKEVWPDIKTVTCCNERNENKENKYQMTKHLASLAGLAISEDKTMWIS